MKYKRITEVMTKFKFLQDSYIFTTRPQVLQLSVMSEDMNQHMQCWQYAKFFNRCNHRQKKFLIVLLAILKIVTNCFKWQSHLRRWSRYTELLVMGRDIAMVLEDCWSTTLQNNLSSLSTAAIQNANIFTRVVQSYTFSSCCPKKKLKNSSSKKLENGPI